MTEDTTLKRLYWHSRRGMWELDLLLIPFLEHRYGDLDDTDQAAYQALIEQEDQDYRAISEGSNVSVQELREKAPNEWFITASEAKAMGLIAEVV